MKRILRRLSLSKSPKSKKSSNATPEAAATTEVPPTSNLGPENSQRGGGQSPVVTGPPIFTALEHANNTVKLEYYGSQNTVAPLLDLCAHQSDDEVVHELQNYMEKDNDTIILKYDESIQDLEVEFGGDLSVEAIAEDLSEEQHDACYILHRFEHQHEGKEIATDLLLFYCPEKTRTDVKFKLAAVKLNLIREMVEVGLPLPNNLAVRDIEGITQTALLEHLYPKKTLKKIHAKPKPKYMRHSRKGRPKTTKCFVG